MTLHPTVTINVLGSLIWPVQEGRQTTESFRGNPYNRSARDELILPELFYRIGELKCSSSKTMDSLTPIECS
jgi:hypothetical protein